MRLKGQILATTEFKVLFQAGHKKTWLPKTEIRLEPNDYVVGPHTVYLPAWLAQRTFSSQAPSTVKGEG